MRQFKTAVMLALLAAILVSGVCVAWVLVTRHKRAQLAAGIRQKITVVEQSVDAAGEAEAMGELNRWTQQQTVTYVMRARRADDHQAISFKQDVGQVDAQLEIELVFADRQMRELHRWRYSPKSNRNIYLLLLE